MANVFQRYHAMLAPVDTATKLPNNCFGLGTFIAVTAGTIAIAAVDGTVKLAPFPVTAGSVTPLYLIAGRDCVLTTAGGASGTITYDS